MFVHHIYEDKAIMLSDTEYALKNPFSYQRASRLVYCNFIEHLVLHIKIFEYPNSKNANELVGVGGIYNFIVPELNDIYSGIKYKVEWKVKCAEVVYPLKDEYLKCIKKLVSINFKYPMLTSFNSKFGLWNEKNNRKIYSELKKIGVKH